MRPSPRGTDFKAWFVPFLYAAGALLVSFSVPRLANNLLPGFVSTVSVNAAIGFYSAIASGMIALTAIVFSLTFVMVQFSATAYSPRLVLWIARDPVVSHSLGVFTATFLYALSALVWVDRGGSGRVPLAGVWVVGFLLIISVMMFIGLIQRVGMLQVNRMLIFTGDQGREVIENLYPPIDTLPSPVSAELPHSPCLQTLLHHGDPRLVQAANISRLVDVASKFGCIVELMVTIGDAVQDSVPILRVYGAASAIPEETLRPTITFGSERTFEQDPKYAIRLLVDIAIKALSPAVNDPTTAVQALDQIEDLLIRLGRRRLEIGAFRDSKGNLRLLMHFPNWEDFLRLAFDEIRFYGATSVQVMRGMKALMNQLISLLPEERRPALRHWQERLQSTIERTFRDELDKLDASDEDPQGLGSSRRKTASN
jgi:uncharacterized membrane protein